MSRSRNEAESAGIQVNEIQHNMKRRLPCHNYSDKGTYMLTLVVEERKPLFGTLQGDGLATAGSENEPRVVLSPLGKAIQDCEIRKISAFYPMVEVWKLCIMPDHLHIIIRVKEKMPEGKNLGQVVRGFKTGCTRAWWGLAEEKGPFGEEKGTEPFGEPKGTGAPGEAKGTEPLGEPKGTGAPGEAKGTEPFGEPKGTGAPGEAKGTEPFGEPKGTGAPGEAKGTGAIVPAGSPAGNRPLLFEKGYCDKVLLRQGQLENWKRYLDDNPRRLAIKRQHPDFFTIIQNIIIGEWSCKAVGNRFLLNIPDKAAVIVHSAYNDAKFAELKAEWLALAENGGVLISAAIATREKEVMREAMDRGCRLIWLRENGFPELYKPAGESFEACSEGRLLQISTWDYHMQRKTISREQCLMLNRLAEEIASH